MVIWYKKQFKKDSWHYFCGFKSKSHQKSIMLANLVNFEHFYIFLPPQKILFRIILTFSTLNRWISTSNVIFRPTLLISRTILKQKNKKRHFLPNFWPTLITHDPQKIFFGQKTFFLKIRDLLLSLVSFVRIQAKLTILWLLKKSSYTTLLFPMKSL